MGFLAEIFGLGATYSYYASDKRRYSSFKKHED